MNIFKQFYRSIYSPKHIALFRFQGIGKTILYVFMISLFSILPTVYFLSTAISSGLDTAKFVIKSELPPFTIQNGVLHAKTTVPITIDKENFTLFLDPTGTLSETKISGTENGIALLKNKVIFIAGEKSETYPYSMFGTTKISNSEVIRLLNALIGLKIIMIPVLSLFIYIFTSASYFIEVSILALFGLGLKNIIGRKLNYPQLWRMSAYSITLPTLFFFIMDAIKTTVPAGSLLNWAVAIIVLCLGISEIPKPKKIE